MPHLVVQEIAAWYTKYSSEKQGRVMAESAVQDTLGKHAKLAVAAAGYRTTVSAEQQRTSPG